MFYSYLREYDNPNSGRIVEISEERLKQVLIPMIKAIEFDENYYKRENADIAEGLASGEIPSARYHYVNYGYFEDRLPRAVAVDEKWYLTEYGDVAQAVAEGRLMSGAQHFFKSGFKEGRLPSKGWSLLGDPSGSAQAAVLPDVAV